MAATARAATAKLGPATATTTARAATAVLYSPQQIWTRTTGTWLPGLPAYAQTAAPFALVTLHTGTWTQTAGPAVTLTGTPSTFTAPGVPGGTTLTFTSGNNTETVTVSPWKFFFFAAGGMKAARFTRL